MRISGIRLALDEDQGALEKKLLRRLGVPAREPKSYQIHKEAVDARRRGEITFVYTVDVDVAHEARAAARLGEAARRAPDAEYRPPGKGSGPLP